jgi:prepilin-type N-terminal cleavage/methylation domain-containing protein
MHKKGFTIVEIMTVTVILAILATFVIISLNRQQIQARDAERSTKATLIASSLEKYYDKYGEYPSPRALLSTYGGNTGTVVAALLGITDNDILVMPEASAGTTNSIAAALSSSDVFAYVAQSATGNDDCQTNIAGGCDEFTLSYKKEIDASTVTIESTYKGRAGDYVTPLQAPSKPTLAVAQSGTNLVATSSVPTCSTDPVMTPKYSFREQVGAGAWSAWTAWQAGNTYARGSNTNATSYTFQVEVRCEAGATIGDTSPVSDPQSVTYYTAPTAPATPSLSLSPAAGTIATSATATASGGACNYGTLQYAIDYRTNDGTWTTGTWGAGTTQTATSNQGDKYGFRATARCVNGTQTLASSVGAEVTVITGVQAPAAPTVSGSGPTWSWTPSACVAGSSPYYQYQFSYWTTALGWANTTAWTWTSATTITNPAATSEGMLYGINVQEYCYSGYVNSAYSATANGGTLQIPVTHVAPQYVALKLLTGGYPSIKIKSFASACASGLDRYVSVGTDIANTGTYTVRPLVDVSTGTTYATFAPAPDGEIVKITSQAVPASGYVEFEIRGHCQNAVTGYGQNSGGYYTTVSLYDYGNLHFISTTQYNNSCTPDSPNMYCEAGFDSAGTSGTTNTGAKACNVKTSSNTYINATATKWSDRFNLNADNVCWTT